jgi:hypothetical protein
MQPYLPSRFSANETGSSHLSHPTYEISAKEAQ